MGKYYVTIGIEMHCEGSKTNSKMFSPSKNTYNDLSNDNVCEIDMGFPGVLPAPNKKGVEQAIKMATVLHSNIPKYMYWERKNYYYPDLPKGYQLTQNPPYDCIGNGGYIDIEREDGSTFRVEIDNLHLEEDSAQMEHLYNTSIINYNRCGVPLFELVTKPCLHNADDTILYLEYIRSIYQYLGISEADSKKGQIRCDVNVSISDDENTLGTKVETKNVNSFSAVRDVINYEIERQSILKDQGRYNEVEQETRRWDEETGTTVRMRSKVDAIDYKYFVEPNIPKIKIEESWVEEIKKTLPELPYERKNKYINDLGLSDYDSRILIKEKKTSDYFEECLKLGTEPKTAANWIITMILGYIYKEFVEIDEIFLTPERLYKITETIKKGTISSKQGKELFNLVLERNEEPEKIMKDEGMEQISDDDAIKSIIEEVLSENPSQIEAYKNGKTNMFDYFVGQVMKKTRGQANPSLVKEILTELLK